MPFRKPNSPFWYVSWEESGRTRSRSSKTADFQEAKRLEHTLRAKKPKTNRHTIEEVLGEYLTDKPTERAAYAAKRLLEHWSGKYIDEITPAEITEYKRLREVSRGTLQKELGFLRAAINHCNLHLGWQLPEVTKGKMPGEPKGRVRWITPTEANKLIEHSAEHIRRFIILGLNTGMRSSEMLGLTWDRVDLIRREIKLDPVDQKAERYDIVPINQSAYDVIRECIGNHKSHVLTFKPSKEKPHQPILRIKNGFQRACERAGIENFTPHDLRHTAASWMVQSGVSIQAVKEVLRHADISTTMRYAHLAPDAARSAVSAMENAMASVQNTDKTDHSSPKHCIKSS